MGHHLPARPPCPAARPVCPRAACPQVCPMAPFPRPIPPDEGGRRPRHPCAPAARRSGQTRSPALPGHEHRIDRHQRNPYAFQATSLIPNPRDHHGQQRTFRLRLFPVPPPVRRAPHQRGQRPRPHCGERPAAARAAPQPRSRTGRAGRHPHAAPAHARHRGPHRGHGLLSAGPCHHLPGLPGPVPQKRAHRPHLHRRAAQEQQRPRRGRRGRLSGRSGPGRGLRRQCRILRHHRARQIPATRPHQCLLVHHQQLLRCLARGGQPAGRVRTGRVRHLAAHHGPRLHRRPRTGGQRVREPVQAGRLPRRHHRRHHRLYAPGQAHRRSPALGPHHRGRPSQYGQDGLLALHGPQCRHPPGRARGRVLAGNEQGTAHAAHAGRVGQGGHVQAAPSGPAYRRRLEQPLRRGRRHLARAHLYRRHPGPDHPGAARPCPPPQGRKGPGPGHRGLPPAHAHQPPHRLARTGDLGHLPLPQGPGQGDERARGGPFAAQPKSGRTRRQASHALGPA